jgi:tyrosyl-tRNA synthetase
MTLSEELAWRGFINQTTYPDLKVLDGQKITFYHGFDASADSQTIGNLAGMMLDRLFLKHGHKGVILAGGATSLIGDPGGKDAERPLQDEAAIAANIEKAKAELNKVLAGYDYTLVNNLDWTSGLQVIPFLRDYGKHFSMTPLIQRDYIARRLGEGGEGISYAEFSYTILQGMDYLHLFDNEGVSLQLGGSDQWGNILSGVELVRKARGAEVHALTLPLIVNKATGKKFGKSEDGAIWLDAAKTSPTQFYQFWLNTSDDAVEDYLKIFTELSKETIDTHISEFNNNRTSRSAQRILALETTKLVHGEEEAKKAELVTRVITGLISIGEISSEELMIVREQLGSASMRVGESYLDAMVKTGLSASNTEARRLLGSGAVYINHQSLNHHDIRQNDFQNERIILRRGKAYKDSILIDEAK